MDAFYYELEGPLKLVKRQTFLPLSDLRGNQVVAETIYSAISTGTEIAAWLGLPPLRPSTVYPRLIGYCNLAKVINVGDQISRVKPGDYILTHQSHRSAFVCGESEILAVTSGSNSETLKSLTATYLYHLGYSALINAEYFPGKLVGVVGMGTLGITTASLLKVFGSEPFIFSNQVLDKKKWPLSFQKQSTDLSAVRRLTPIDGLDIVVNTSNSWDDHLLSMQLCRKGATVVCLGFPGRGESLPSFNPLSSEFFYDKQITFRHCGYTPDHDVPAFDLRFTKKRNLSYLANLIENGKLDPKEILTLERPASELEGIYQKLAERSGGTFSALLNWR